MAQYDFLFDHHIVPAFVPVADAFAGGLTTEAVSLTSYRKATLVVITGAIEDANISNLVTVEASDDASGSTTTAMAFRHRAQQYSTTVDTWSSLTAATSSGYNFASNNAVANTVWFLEVLAEEVQAAQAGAQFVRALVAETANKTITAGGIWILSEPRQCDGVPETAIA